MNPAEAWLEARKKDVGDNTCYVLWDDFYMLILSCVVEQMFALLRQFTGLVGLEGDLSVPDCDGSTNSQGDYNGYDGGFVVNVSWTDVYK